MKKLFILLVIGIAATLVGCKPQYYYDYTTNNYYEGGECYYHTKVIDLDATADSWVLNTRDDGTQFISASFDIPALTSTVYNYGA